MVIKSIRNSFKTGAISGEEMYIGWLCVPQFDYSGTYVLHKVLRYITMLCNSLLIMLGQSKWKEKITLL